MNDFIYINGRPVYVSDENEDTFELTEFAPDGEQTKYIVAKKQCERSVNGNMTAKKYKLEF